MTCFQGEEETSGGQAAAQRRPSTPTGATASAPAVAPGHSLTRTANNKTEILTKVGIDKDLRALSLTR